VLLLFNQLISFVNRCVVLSFSRNSMQKEPRETPYSKMARSKGIWVVAHDQRRKFDREDERIIEILSQFASAGWRKAKDLGVLTARDGAEAVDLHLRHKEEIAVGSLIWD
jgi:hypothetical protein